MSERSKLRISLIWISIAFIFSALWFAAPPGRPHVRNAIAYPDSKDAARYRWIISNKTIYVCDVKDPPKWIIDQAIDRALAGTLTCPNSPAVSKDIRT
jgi:hypothetical protein